MVPAALTSGSTRGEIFHLSCEIKQLRIFSVVTNRKNGVHGVHKITKRFAPSARAFCPENEKTRFSLGKTVSETFFAYTRCALSFAITHRPIRELETFARERHVCCDFVKYRVAKQL